MATAIKQLVLCPYCCGVPEYVDSIAVYRRSYGMIYLCRSCEAWVGVHDGTNKALGRLANKDLRRAKVSAHRLFNSLWRRVMSRDQISKSKARGKAYKWLAGQMNLLPSECHIGMFSAEQCREAAALCRNIGGGNE